MYIYFLGCESLASERILLGAYPHTLLFEIFQNNQITLSIPLLLNVNLKSSVDVNQGNRRQNVHLSSGFRSDQRLKIINKELNQ